MSVSPLHDVEQGLSDAQEGDAHEQESTMDVEEEAQTPRIARAPVKPSSEEVDSHMVTHLPFRSWCAHYVRGKLRGKPHLRQDGRDGDILTVALDCMFSRVSQ